MYRPLIGQLLQFGNTGILICGIGILVLQQTMRPYRPTPESTIDTRWYLPCFLFGIIAALLLPTLRKLPREHLATPYALACLALLIVLLPGTQLWLFGTQPNDYLVNKHLYFGLMWVAFIALLVDGHGLAGRLLCSRPMSFLGAISYSAYLFHLLIMLPLTRQWPQQTATYLAAIGLSITAGAAGYYLAERPLEHLRRQLSARARNASL